MPEQVHAIVWFPEPDQLSHFMKQWKQPSSVGIKTSSSQGKLIQLRPHSDRTYGARLATPVL